MISTREETLQGLPNGKLDQGAGKITNYCTDVTPIQADPTLQRIVFVNERSVAIRNEWLVIYTRVKKQVILVIRLLKS